MDPMNPRSRFIFINSFKSSKNITPRTVQKGVKLYEFEVVLRNTRPAVKRRIVIAGTDNLQQLGRVAIRAIGMSRCKFELWGADGEYIRGHNPFFSDSDSDSDSDFDLQKTKKRNSRGLLIYKFFDLRKKNEIVLDYGQDWNYVITLMKIRENDLQLYPKCISGKNASPPEDVGGPDGYKHLLKTLKNPKHN